MLLGGLSVGALTGCAPGSEGTQPRITTDSVYTNDTYIAGAGYYHAPFNAFFPIAYNHFDSARGQYYAGGSWQAEPHRSVINISAPTAAAALAAESARDAQISRGGFGSTSNRHSIWS